MSENLLTKDQLAKKLNVGGHVIRDLYRRRLIPVIRLGHKTIRFDLAEVEGALASLTTKAKGGAK